MNQFSGCRKRNLAGERMPTIARQNRDLCYHCDIASYPEKHRHEHQWHSRGNLSAREPRRPDDGKPTARSGEGCRTSWLGDRSAPTRMQGISGAKGRDQRPAFDAMLKDAVRRRYDILLVWSIDRLGRSVLHVANALAELDAAGIRLYCDQQGINSSTPMGRAMIQMASIFGEQERSMLREQGRRRAGAGAPTGQEAWPAEGVAEG